MLGFPVVIYLFLGGTGGGIGFVLSCLALARPKLQRWLSLSATMPKEEAQFNALSRFFIRGYLISAVFLVVGICCLLVDLGRTDRLELLLTHPSVSFISIGAYALFMCLVFTALLIVDWTRLLSLPASMRGFDTLAAGIMAVVIMLYTGMMLQNLTTVPLWNSWSLPVLFFCSALSCGLAVLVMLACCTGVFVTLLSLMRFLLRIDAVVIILEVCATVILISAAFALVEPALLLQTPTEQFANNLRTNLAALAALNLVVGPRSLWFWLGYIFLGLALPFIVGRILQKSSRFSQEILIVFSLSVLVGGFIMRACIVFAGCQVGSMI